MLNRKLLFIFVLVKLSFFGQVNLVPNPSFENVTACPNGFSQLGLASPWSQAGTGTPDLYASCSTSTDVGIPINLYGSQIAHTGLMYSGLQCMCAEYREYIEVPLTNSLTFGTKYFVSFFVSLADTFAFTSSSLGAYLSTGSLSVNNYSPITVSPQIQNGQSNYFTKNLWTKVTGTFNASGGENFITIGNFNSTVNTTSLAIETNTMVYNPNCIYFYIDDICVTSDSSFNETWTGIETQVFNNKAIIKLYPNPTYERLFIKRNKLIKNLNLTIYNSKMSVQLEFINLNQEELDISSLSSGIYIVKLWSENFIQKEIIIKN
jgi:hypothetical protein